MYHRDDARWRTRFGSWVGEYTVAAIVSDLSGDPSTRVTRHAVYKWLAGHRPDWQRARALVALSDGQLDYQAIYAHPDEIVQEDLKVRS